MNAAYRVASTSDGTRSDRLSRLAMQTSEVVMVSGHSGAGKSCLVRGVGTCFEKRGWSFLRCKFDRVGESDQSTAVLEQSMRLCRYSREILRMIP